MQNLFLDARLLDGGAGSLTGRVGRQELLYGQQRVVSPLDWANTRRTFDGGKMFWSGGNWNVDGFWTRPLRRDFGKFDSPNLDQQFYGIWGSYKGLTNGKLDTYWLGFDNDVTGFRVDSLGVNYQRTANNWMLDIWGDYQFGTNADDSTHNAGAWTLGVGRSFCHRWKPALWVFYDWASGTSDQGAGNGYFHFFPLAHKYLGFMDLYGRRNIETPNIRFSCQPHKKLKLLLWYYYFFLENRNDTPYGVTMSPFFAGIRPSSADLGHEIDATATYSITPRTSLLFGYSHFFSGAYYDTPGLPYNGDADFFYTQFHVNF